MTETFFNAEEKIKNEIRIIDNVITNVKKQNEVIRKCNEIELSCEDHLFIEQQLEQNEYFIAYLENIKDMRENILKCIIYYYEIYGEEYSNE